MHPRDLRLGMRVVVQRNKAGTVRFLGRTKFAKDDWVGVELDHAAGKHDGCVEGVRYFQTVRPNTGVFVRAADVELEPALSRPGSGHTSPMPRVESNAMLAAIDAAQAGARPSSHPGSRRPSAGVDGSLAFDSSGAHDDDDEDDAQHDEGDDAVESEEDDSPGPDPSARGHGSSARGGHFRSSSDAARLELAELLKQPTSAFLANKSGIVRELTTRIARRPSTTDMIKSGILLDRKKARRASSKAGAGGKGAATPSGAAAATPASPGAAGWGLGGTAVLAPPQRRLFVFGENAHGELSTGDENDCFLPTEIKLPSARSQKAPAAGNTPSASTSTPSSSSTGANASGVAIPATPHALNSTSLGTSDFAQVCLGLHHMVVLTWNNEVLTCGSWVANLLGTDDRANLHRLKRLKQFENLRAAFPDNPIISIGCGDRHTVALHQDGACESFGGSLYGKLGHRSSGATAFEDGTLLGADAPSYSSIPGLHGQRVTQMDAGNWHTVCCTMEGAVYSFGGGGKFYNQGQLGHADTEDRMVPRRIERFGHLPSNKVFVVSICCGGYHTLALTRDRLVYSWGSSKFGQLGLGSDNNESTPQLVTGLLTAGSSSGRTIGLAAGENHSLCVQADGSVYSWGFSLQGQCGHGLSQNEKLPKKIQFFAQRNIHVVQVDAGWRHSIALSDTHSVYTFGHGDKGQLGLGDTRSHSLPQLVDSLEGLDIRTVAAGGSHSLAFNDFFKAAQELVFLQKVRAFTEVKTQGSSARVPLVDETKGLSVAEREAQRLKRLGYAASPANNSRRRSTSPHGKGSPSKADFGLASPNPLVPLELKTLLREVAPEEDEDEDAAAEAALAKAQAAAAARNAAQQGDSPASQRRALRKLRGGAGGARGSGDDSGDGTGFSSDDDGGLSSGRRGKGLQADFDEAGASDASPRQGLRSRGSPGGAAARRAAAKAAADAEAARAEALAAAARAHATLTIELVHSAHVAHTHRFFTFQTSTPEASVRDLIAAYVAGPHAGASVLLQQLLVTPGNTVSREDAAGDSAFDSVPHHAHTFSYAPQGPPRFTLLLVLKDAQPPSDSDDADDSAASLWPPWAADFHAQLRALCSDIAPGMQSRRTEEERAAADPAQPCFRELRPAHESRHA